MGTQQFLVPGTLAGETISVMPDSGATISFLSRALAKRLDLKILKSEKIQVRIGDNSVHITDEYVQEDLFLGDDIKFSVRFQLMDIPGDLILGMDFMVENDVWLHPASKRMATFVNGKQHVLAVVQREVDVRKFPDSHEELNLGIYIDDKAGLEIQNLSASTMAKLQKK
eukprot:SAG11_NODE_8319_length_1029_cov_2.296774_2_plen_168_part_01